MGNGRYILDQADLISDTPDLLAVMNRRAEEEGSFNATVRESGPFADLESVRKAITLRCYRVLDVAEGRYLSIEEIGKEEERNPN